MTNTYCQTFNQRYINEEQIFPSPLKTLIKKNQSEVGDILLEKKNERAEKRKLKLLKKQNDYKLLLKETRKLGPKHRILTKQRHEFMEKISTVANVTFEELKKKNPLQWRNFLVRTICLATDDNSSKLKQLWCDMYAGDLKWGVRDVRMTAKKNHWPESSITSRNDRNSWISAYLRQGFLSELRNATK